MLNKKQFLCSFHVPLRRWEAHDRMSMKVWHTWIRQYYRQQFARSLDQFPIFQSRIGTNHEKWTIALSKILELLSRGSGFSHFLLCHFGGPRVAAHILSPMNRAEGQSVIT